MDVLTIVFVANGVALTALALPLARRAIGPNPLYGFRVRRTLENPDVWYAVNEYTGRRLIVVGVATVLAAFLLRCVPGIGVDSYALAVAGVNVGGLLVTLILGLRYLASLPR